MRNVQNLFLAQPPAFARAGHNCYRISKLWTITIKKYRLPLVNKVTKILDSYLHRELFRVDLIKQIILIRLEK